MNKTNRQTKAFFFLFLAGLVVASSLLFKTYALNTGYERPSPFLAISTLFYYLGFSVTAYIFPWSWKIKKGRGHLKAISIIIVAITFVVVHLLITTFLEWATIIKKYAFWNGFAFTLFHSGLLTLFVYGLISTLLFATGIVRKKENTKNSYLNRISYKHKGKTTFININVIQLFEANDNYINVYTNKNQRYLIRKTIGKLEKQLDPELFQRVHRKHIVNLNEIESLKPDPNGGYLIYLPFKKIIKLSKSYKNKLSLLIEKDI